ncbi:uncharacterized protein TNCV_4319631 [Trichonephila clavipes]|nr:uncharacterized protein TNCV_4319631 [Trichonephila clavipes]
MSQIDTSPANNDDSCNERLRVTGEIEAHEILLSNYLQLDSTPNDKKNQEMKANEKPSKSQRKEMMLCRLIDLILTSYCSATRGLLTTDHVILNHGQVTWTTPELAPHLLTTTPHQREDVSALNRFNVHRCPTRRVFSGIGLELVTRQATQVVAEEKPIETPKHRLPPLINLKIKKNIRKQLKIMYKAFKISLKTFKISLNNYSSVRSCIIIHQNEVIANCTGIREDTWIKDLIPISHTSKSSSLEHVQVSVTPE